MAGEVNKKYGRNLLWHKINLTYTRIDVSREGRRREDEQGHKINAIDNRSFSLPRYSRTSVPRHCRIAHVIVPLFPNNGNARGVCWLSLAGEDNKRIIMWTRTTHNDIAKKVFDEMFSADYLAPENRWYITADRPWRRSGPGLPWCRPGSFCSTAIPYFGDDSLPRQA